jgi:hypothetical protein
MPQKTGGRVMIHPRFNTAFSGVICQTTINSTDDRPEGDYVPFLHFCRNGSGNRNGRRQGKLPLAFLCQHVAGRVKQRIYVRPHLWEVWLFKPGHACEGRGGERERLRLFTPQGGPEKLTISDVWQMLGLQSRPSLHAGAIPRRRNASFSPTRKAGAGRTTPLAGGAPRTLRSAGLSRRTEHGY